MEYSYEPSKIMKQRYVDFPNECPFCNANDTYGIVAGGDSQLEEVMCCDSCKKTWLAIKEVTGLLLLREDGQPQPPEPVYCSDDVQQAALVSINNRLEERHMQHALVSEADFLMGATTAMGIASGSEPTESKVWGPATAWIFYIMGNRSVLAERLRKRGMKEAGDKVEAEQEQFTRWYRHMDEMVEFVKHVYHEARHLEMGHRQVERLRYKAESVLDTLGELDLMDDEDD